MFDRFAVARSIDAWLAEDIGHADLTTELMVDPAATSRFFVHAREPVRVAGVEVAAAVFRRYEPRLTVDVLATEGGAANGGDVLMRVAGPAAGILTAERTALNILQRLSGIATETARYVQQIEGTGARLVDTRKTTPGLRMLEKHAVTCGGGLNHRLGLDSGVLIKDNHIAVCGGVGPAIARARRQVPILTRLEVECDTLAQVEEALAGGADLILLDNMDTTDLRTAVRLAAGRARLEASGGIRLDTVRAVAETGVDYISTSRITQAAPAPDIGLDEAE